MENCCIACLVSSTNMQPFSQTTRADLKIYKNCPSADELAGKTVVMDVEGVLLRSSATFPYFMLVALEAGSFLRGLTLLLVYPFVLLLGHEMGLKLMVMVSFCGIRAKGFRAGRAVLPKFFLEDVGAEGFKVMRMGKRSVCVSGMPRVMVEGFLKEHLGVDLVFGRELKVFRGYYVGLLEEEEEEEEGVGLESTGLVGGGVGFLGRSSFERSIRHPFFSHSKETYVVNEADKKNWKPLPRKLYQKPLIFQDGRVAFRPTATNTMGMCLWLPLGFPLAIIRVFLYNFLPFKLSTPLIALTGFAWRLRGTPPSRTATPPNKGRLYVCNHRTLMDPVYVSIALNEPATAVTYSLSRLSECISCINTVRLTRDRANDAEIMLRVLKRGNLVVCPEGTTCREPYLLRFSPLFAELADEVTPVAVDVKVSMFYGTTAGGAKWMDPLFFLLNPRMTYQVEFLNKVSTACVRVGACLSTEMANHVQKEIGKALGFECTTLTRKDKYFILCRE